jgi:hypothetical protein
MGNKYLSFATQREDCRLDGKTYTEKIHGAKILFCNFPFTDIHHKRGLCKASTCTDLRQIPEEVVRADENCETGECTVSGTDGNAETVTGKAIKTTEGELACPSNE